MIASIRFIAIVLGGALLIYSLLLLIVWLIPALPASQILPQYPTLVLLWVSVCLIVVAIRFRNVSGFDTGVRFVLNGT